MKKSIKYLFLFSVIMLTSFFSGCSLDLSNSSDNTDKTYNVNEVISNPKFNITLNDIYATKNFEDVKTKKDSYIHLEFKIVNQSDIDMVLNDNNFLFKIKGKEESEKDYINLNSNRDIIVKANESLMVELVYDIEAIYNYVLEFNYNDSIYSFEVNY